MHIILSGSFSIFLEKRNSNLPEVTNSHDSRCTVQLDQRTVRQHDLLKFSSQIQEEYMKGIPLKDIKIVVQYMQFSLLLIYTYVLERWPSMTETALVINLGPFGNIWRKLYRFSFLFLIVQRFRAFLSVIYFPYSQLTVSTTSY